MRSLSGIAPALLLFSLRSAAQMVTATSAPGIFALVTPTVQPEQVDTISLLSFSDDCLAFYQSYIYADTFNFGDVIPAIVATATQTSVVTAQLYSLDIAYFAGVTSLADNPTAYMKSLAASAAFWPETFSSALMSQATGLLLGYESIVSKDFLGVTPSPSITPGMGITVSGAVATSTTAMVVTSNGQTSTAAVKSTASSAGSGQAGASSAGAGVALASASPELIVSAAAAAAGVVGMILL